MFKYIVLIFITSFHLLANPELPSAAAASSSMQVNGLAQPRPDYLNSGLQLNLIHAPVQGRIDPCTLQIYRGHLLGSGSFSEVFLGHYKGNYVAVKVLKEPTPKMREYELLKQLNHANIIKLIAVVWTPEHHIEALVFPYYAQDLFTHIKNYKNYGPINAFKYILQLADALDYLRQKNIAHFDVKPSNILVDNNGDIQLMDFGMGYQYESRWKFSATNDRRFLNTYCGTGVYAAPECQYLHSSGYVFSTGEMTPAADVYSFGVTLWQILTRESIPKNNSDFLSQIPSGLNGIDSVRLAFALIKQCTDADPLRRPSWAQIKQRLAFILALEHANYRQPMPQVSGKTVWQSKVAQ